jgi:Domain of unknown function (DUF4381)
MRSFFHALELRPIPSPEAPPPEIPWLGYVALAATLVVGLLALVALAFIWRLRRNPVTPLSPHAWALAELARIEKRPTTDAEGRRRQVEAVANVLRRYLSLRFRLPAPEQTTEEFRMALQEHAGLAEEKRSRVLVFLAQADLVKFARGVIPAEDLQTYLAELRQFITETAGE